MTHVSGLPLEAAALLYFRRIVKPACWKWWSPVRSSAGLRNAKQ